MNDSELAFNNHLGLGIDVELIGNDGNKQNFHLEPIGLEKINVIFKLAKYLDNDQFPNNLNDEAIDLLKKLLTDTVKNSYPNISDEVISKFVSSNFMDLIIPCLVINSPKLNSGRKELLERIKQLGGK